MKYLTRVLSVQFRKLSLVTPKRWGTNAEFYRRMSLESFSCLSGVYIHKIQG